MLVDFCEECEAYHQVTYINGVPCLNECEVAINEQTTQQMPLSAKNDNKGSRRVVYYQHPELSPQQSPRSMSPVSPRSNFTSRHNIASPRKTQNLPVSFSAQEPIGASLPLSQIQTTEQLPSVLQPNPKLLPNPKVPQTVTVTIPVGKNCIKTEAKPVRVPSKAQSKPRINYVFRPIKSYNLEYVTPKVSQSDCTCCCP